MAQVTVLVNGRNYTLACEDGEEEHLTELAAFIDSRVVELGRSIGQVGDARLMLMASLVVADELAVAHDRVDELELEVERLKETAAAVQAPVELPPQASVIDEDAIAEVLESAARRLEDIAARLS